MDLGRREFIEKIGFLTAATTIPEPSEAGISTSGSPANDERLGVLVDIPNCIGCRKCEFACQEAAGLNPPPIKNFDDQSVFADLRRPSPSSYTTVNRYANAAKPSAPVYVKLNCLHCNEPACASACLVGALRKQPNGAVTYDANKCMGCRYCMVACPFQIPTYDYDNPLTPQVRKCSLCFEHISKKGRVPACVKICPRECLTFGKRSELLALAHEKVRRHPENYQQHVYGEFEAGGTSWLYLSAVPFAELGFLTLPGTSPARLTETIQHAVFKRWMPPLALYGLLGLTMWLGRRNEEVVDHDRAQTGDARGGEPT